MTTPHQWAAEIHAMADGKEVEGFYCGEWTPARKDFNPIAHPKHQWRINPEKKVLRYRVAKMKNDKWGWLSFADNQTIARHIEQGPNFVEWLHDWQEVEVE